MTTVAPQVPRDRMVTKLDLDTGRLRLDLVVIVSHCGQTKLV